MTRAMAMWRSPATLLSKLQTSTSYAAKERC
ncbi:UNVERIFIED_CONTAM: hypothetical protein GTU68_051831 [Idotea baltica]|nr:hypothetical protein [Idotea baltica]